MIRMKQTTSKDPSETSVYKAMTGHNNVAILQRNQLWKQSNNK